MTKPAAPFMFLAVWLSSLAPASAADPGYQVVVNVANPTETLSRLEVTRIFMIKTTVWPNGRPVLPVDQKTLSPTRRAFSKEVLGQEPSQIASYWNQMIFSGRGTPPLSIASDAEALAYVRANPNSIGYVAGDAAVGEGVKVLKVQK